MISRRDLMATGGALGAASILGGCTATAQEAGIAAAAPPASELTPDQALQLLREGNAAFLRGEQTSA